MELKTDRLFIREIAFNDWEGLQRIVIDFGNSIYRNYDMHFPVEEHAIQKLVIQLANSHLFFSVFLKGSSEMIGYVCFHNDSGQYDLGFCFHSAYFGKGYGYESCSALLNYMKQFCGAVGFTAGTALANTPSCKLLEKLGFVCRDTEELSFHKDEIGNDIIFRGGKFAYVSED
ncbi:GNAT family N-acetyltransferase [Anaerocolumna sp. AGMB13020]|uniref:GNAT family N-acetyltransferase n=1 Tax=Anaerocolumna sp. AGMB13020 TaxID=3081750 RepID=UPI002954ECBA|nr:GNAT family N-acetyltransferase [Anaerocolumna sp. AGMB13020]WOO34840.1 GNAT family N-acetyltransferase [Anaerocolumna sp. AGMB13020]